MEFLFPLSRLCDARVWLRAASLLFLLGPASVHATTFSWSSWSAGAPVSGTSASQSYTATGGTPPPSAVTVTLTNSGETWSTNALDGLGTDFPTVGTNPITGGGTTNGLQLVTHSQTSTSSYIQVTVSFSTPVSNVSFQIWDVDSSPTQFTDQISNIQAQPWSSGGPVAANSVTGSADNTVLGSGLSTIVTGNANNANNSANGNVTIKFTGPITSFTFRWSNIASGLGLQGIAMGPITYTPVATPEVGSTLGALGVCALVIGAREIRKRRRTQLV